MPSYKSINKCKSTGINQWLSVPQRVSTKERESANQHWDLFDVLKNSLIPVKRRCFFAWKFLNMEGNSRGFILPCNRSYEITRSNNQIDTVETRAVLQSISPNCVLMNFLFIEMCVWPWYNICVHESSKQFVETIYFRNWILLNLYFRLIGGTNIENSTSPLSGGILRMASPMA